MGTDAEKTVERVSDQVDYFLTCCQPENKEEILQKLIELKFLINPKGDY